MGKEAVKIALPQVNYSIVDPSALIPANVQDKQAIAFGFNSGLDWEYGNEDSAGIADNDGRYIRWLRKFTARTSSNNIIYFPAKYGESCVEPSRDSLYTHLDGSDRLCRHL